MSTSMLDVCLAHIRKWCRKKSICDENLFVRQLRHNGLTEPHIVIVLNTLDDICRECWNAWGGCQCWNDE